MSTELYLIWSNEHNAWWGPGRIGYTTEPSKAGRYSLAEASQICEDANRYSQEVQERMVLIAELRKEAE
jgi:hypothetical protein